MQLKHFFILLFSALTTPSFSQRSDSSKVNTRWLKGIYLQAGFGRYAFTRSNIHFSDGNSYDFVVHGAKAHDQPDFDGVIHDPLEITIPQYVYRIGFYLNKAKTNAIEFNFDHSKYVVTDYQRLRVTGQIHELPIDRDTVINPYSFMHMEHTNGANFYHINYVRFTRFGGRQKQRFAYLMKAGAGVVVPKTDVTLFGTELDTKYKIAGYIISTEQCFRAYPLGHWYFELSGKGGFANYVNANSIANGKISHHFWYLGATLTTGFDIGF